MVVAVTLGEIDHFLVSTAATATTRVGVVVLRDLASYARRSVLVRIVAVVSRSVVIGILTVIIPSIIRVGVIGCSIGCWIATTAAALSAVCEREEQC